MAKGEERLYGETSSSSGRRSGRTREKRQEEDFQEEGAQARPSRDCVRAGVIQQHHRDYLRHERECSVVEEFGVARLPRIAQGNSVRRTAGSIECREHGARSRSSQRGCACERARIGPGICSACIGCRRDRGSLDPRRHADSAQWMPSAEEAESVRIRR